MPAGAWSEISARRRPASISCISAGVSIRQRLPSKSGFRQAGTDDIAAVSVEAACAYAGADPIASLSQRKVLSTDRVASRPILFLFPRALDDLRPEAGAERLPSRDVIGIVDASDMARRSAGDLDAGDDALLVQIDARRLGGLIVRELEGLGVADAKDLMDAFARDAGR